MNISFVQSQHTPYLLDYQVGSCDMKKDASKIKTRISNLKTQCDTTWVEITFTDMCGQTDFVGTMSLKNNQILLDYEHPLAEIFCMCCYSIIYKIIGYQANTHQFLFKNKHIIYTEQEYIVQTIQVDTFANGAIRKTAYQDGIKYFEKTRDSNTHTDTIRYFQNGILTKESIKKN